MMTWRQVGTWGIVASLAMGSLSAEETPIKQRESVRKHVETTVEKSVRVEAATPAEAVDAELRDVGKAVRRLDQSYTVRGFQGRGAATAGSVHIDWESRGVPVQNRFHPAPPAPLVLSKPKGSCLTVSATVVATPQPVAPVVDAAVDADVPPLPKSAPVVGQPCCPTLPAVTQPCPCAETKVPAVAGCAGCETTPLPAATVVRPILNDCDTCQPAPIYVGLGGRTPPGAVMINGQWSEAPSRAGCASGYGVSGSGYSVTPGVRIAPSALQPGAYGVW